MRRYTQWKRGVFISKFVFEMLNSGMLSSVIVGVLCDISCVDVVPFVSYENKVICSPENYSVNSVTDYTFFMLLHEILRFEYNARYALFLIIIPRI